VRVEYAIKEMLSESGNGKTLDFLSRFLVAILENAKAGVDADICEIEERFKALATLSEAQSDEHKKIIEAAGELEVEGKKITIQEFIKFFDSTFDSVFEKIFFISQKSVRIIYSMDDAVEQLRKVESFISRIQDINNQAHTLSMNAKIEAVKLGSGFGESFSVVASEVKHVSQEISKLSLEMRTQIKGVSESIRSGYDDLRELVTTDLSANILEKDKLDVLMHSVARQSDKLRRTLAVSVENSARVSGNINRIFAEIQHNNNHAEVSEFISDVLQNIGDLSAYSTGDSCNRLAVKINSLKNEKIKKEIHNYMLSLSRQNMD